MKLDIKVLKKEKRIYVDLESIEDPRVLKSKKYIRAHTFSARVEAKILANNGDFLSKMAITGHGILVTPTFISWQALAVGDLVPVLSEYSLPTSNAYAVYPKTRYLSQRARLLIDHLLERFGDNPYWDQSLKL